MIFLGSLQSEWLKTRRSAASWLCLSGGFFLPLMFLIGAFVNQADLNMMNKQGNPWMAYVLRLWQFMGIFLLPFGIVLAASLIMQIEYRSNAWKQLHTTPQSHTSIFCAKLTVIFGMMLKFFFFFNIGMLVSGIIPALIFSRHLPAGGIPFTYLLKLNGQFLVGCLPVLAFQFLLSLLIRSFLVPIGIGLLMVIGTVILIEGWQYAWLSPYSYCPLLVIGAKKIPANVNIYSLSIVYTCFFIAGAYLLYRMKKVKG